MNAPFTPRRVINDGFGPFVSYDGTDPRSSTAFDDQFAGEPDGGSSFVSPFPPHPGLPATGAAEPADVGNHVGRRG